jgi:hypothetical protein
MADRLKQLKCPLTDEWINSRILSCLSLKKKKKGNPVTCDNVGETQDHYAE